jgi:hypothetical protein
MNRSSIPNQISKPGIKKRNPIAKDLGTSKYRNRIKPSKKNKYVRKNKVY